MFKTVLFSVDQSREAREAAEVVASIVQKYQSNLILLSVVEETTPEESPQDDAMKSVKKVEQLLKDAQAFFSAQGIEAKILDKIGKPAFVICDVADEMKVNLIIMGCRGLGLTDEGSHDSVTNRVINLSPCPVLIVP
ncbi:universal stress protein [Plectonema cf. radiosum LEGE 06105]|uniref:Universal stress protein n=1 Tax=Plectonema cf. radiosum LEGE 06105 TaxID=945769 RepID=A0A8J7K3P4_9CYAN|nr:universal stress protein [Plectonema radiosum]MBE9214392.1 universal stress protein [Plectonema cf. radiosum LEGE 06105]